MYGIKDIYDILVTITYKQGSKAQRIWMSTCPSTWPPRETEYESQNIAKKLEQNEYLEYSTKYRELAR